MGMVGRFQGIWWPGMGMAGKCTMLIHDSCRENSNTLVWQSSVRKHAHTGGFSFLWLIVLSITGPPWCFIALCCWIFGWHVLSLIQLFQLLYLVMATKCQRVANNISDLTGSGSVCRAVALANFSKVRDSGLRIMRLNHDDCNHTSAVFSWFIFTANPQFSICKLKPTFCILFSHDASSPKFMGKSDTSDGKHTLIWHLTTCSKLLSGK